MLFCLFCIQVGITPKNKIKIHESMGIFLNNKKEKNNATVLLQNNVNIVLIMASILR